MLRVLFMILIFGLSFLVTSQLMRVSQGEGDALAWALIFVGVVGFIAVLRTRSRLRQGPPPG